jgi:putative redox protein
MAFVSGSIGADHYKTILSNNRQELIGDEPVESGGTDLGFSPSELLSSALVTCTCVTLRMYADRKQWPLEAVHVTVNFERDTVTNSSLMRREIELTGKLTEEQRERLLAIAAQCFIHKTLSNPIHITTILR